MIKLRSFISKPLFPLCDTFATSALSGRLYRQKCSTIVLSSLVPVPVAPTRTVRGGEE